ncbi:MAG: dihydroorotate dehydrogenase [Chloroflexi bacterium]|nr:dihydroorotate dehydrogenase [Chloroflexota bacterium]MDA1270074.1 dihydroorotate dehydrogenase [Chloroflexota bacterium]
MTSSAKQYHGEHDQGPDLSVDLAPGNPHHLRLANPVMIASGTFGYDGYGRGITEDMDLGQLGAVVPKTVTRLARQGNPEPQWYPVSYREAWDAGDTLFLNAIGLTNPGIEAALRDVTPTWDRWNATVLLSFASDSVEQFSEMAAMTNRGAGFQGIELNLSCPNVEDGSLFGHSASLTAQAVAAVRANTDLPVLAKLAPNVPDITVIAKAAVDSGADALTICNTMPAMRIDVHSRQPVLGNITGGLSGPGLRPISLALVYQVAKVVDVPIIGVGGIFTGEDAAEYILAGASAVQIGSANLVGLAAPWRILSELKEWAGQSGVSSLSELTGSARPSFSV